VASDVSAAALEIARANRAALLKEGAARVELVEGDGLAPLVERAGRGYDLLGSNSPCVDPHARDSLAASVRDHAPGLAQFAPEGRPD
jgi:methylase of polypeptide subunit release factors